MGKVEENKRQKKERLLNTAFTLFTTQGLTKTSISDIASAAGVAKGTFYLYFRDKTEIQEELVARKASELFHRAFRRMPEDRMEVEDRLIFVVDDLLSQLQSDPLLLRFINKNLSWGIFRRGLKRFSTQNGQEYMERCYRLMRQDTEEFDRPDIMLFTIIELLGGVCGSVILERDPADLATYKPYLYRNIRAIMECHRKKPAPPSETDQTTAAEA